MTRNGNTVFATSADFGYGVQSFALPSLASGTYSVRLAATDVAGFLAATYQSSQIIDGGSNSQSDPRPFMTPACWVASAP